MSLVDDRQELRKYLMVLAQVHWRIRAKQPLALIEE